MNERIKQLAELSKTPKTMMVDGVLQSVVTIDAERFAELIVRECASRVDNILRERKDGGGTMGDEIREHFGVEE
jgi:hypothetical protein